MEDAVTYRTLLAPIYGYGTGGNKYRHLFHSSGGVMKDDNDVIDEYYGTLRFWNGQASSPVRSWTGAYGAESLSYFGDNRDGPPRPRR